MYCCRSVLIFCFIVATINCYDETEALVPLTLTEEKLKGKKKIKVSKRVQGLISAAKIYSSCPALFFSLIFDILWNDEREERKKKKIENTHILQLDIEVCRNRNTFQCFGNNSFYCWRKMYLFFLEKKNKCHAYYRSAFILLLRAITRYHFSRLPIYPPGKQLLFLIKYR